LSEHLLGFARLDLDPREMRDAVHVIKGQRHLLEFSA
jgi:hypothetical protein